MIRQFGFTWTAISWLLMGYGLFFALSPLQAQTAIKKFSLELKNESLPEALKQLEKAGGKKHPLHLQRNRKLSGDRQHPRKDGTRSHRPCTGRQTLPLHRTGRVFRRAAEEVGQSHRHRRQSI